MQVLTPFPYSAWTPSASDLWRLWNASKTPRPSVAHLSDVEDAEFLLAALGAARIALCVETSTNE
jgi:hypothetical protein